MSNIRRFKNLGVHIDTSRDAVMSVPQLKLFIDRMSKMGYNQLYLYIEDTYEIVGWVPKVTVGPWIHMVSANVVYHKAYF